MSFVDVRSVEVAELRAQPLTTHLSLIDSAVFSARRQKEAPKSSTLSYPVRVSRPLKLCAIPPVTVRFVCADIGLCVVRLSICDISEMTEGTAQYL